MSQLSFDTIRATARPPSRPPSIDGLELYVDTITPTTERELLAAIDAQPWITDLSRRVQHYGYRYDYAQRSTSESQRLGPLPSFLEAAIHAVADAFERPPEQVIVNEYKPGDGIAKHIDCPPCFGPVIATVSLGAPIVMDFENPATGSVVSLDLPPRSTLVLRGAARSEWKHGISKRKSDTVDGVRRPRCRRVSVTLRTMLNVEEPKGA